MPRYLSTNHLYAPGEVGPGLLDHNTSYASAVMCLGVDLYLCDVSLNMCLALTVRSRYVNGLCFISAVTSSLFNMRMSYHLFNRSEFSETLESRTWVGILFSTSFLGNSLAPLSYFYVCIYGIEDLIPGDLCILGKSCAMIETGSECRPA